MTDAFETISPELLLPVNGGIAITQRGINAKAVNTHINAYFLRQAEIRQRSMIFGDPNLKVRANRAEALAARYDHAAEASNPFARVWRQLP